ncbi:RraA family protein [Streptomyces sp. YKOK-I1]
MTETTDTTQSLVKALRDLDTSHVSDALDRLGIAGQCLGVMPLDRAFRLAGPAFTVRYGPVGTDPGTVGDYIDDLDPGTVVVLDNAGRLDVTVWGDLLTATASRRGLGGTVVDGVCRDSDRAFELGYPVYSRGRWMRTGKDRVRVDGYQVPVSVGGVRVEPGDLLLGDADGVVAVPVARAEEVIAAAGRIRDAENRIRAEVEQGTSLTEARAAAGYHTLQTRDRSGH